MFSSLIGMLAGPLLDKLIAPLTNIFNQYINKQITEAQLKEKLQEALIAAAKDIEVSHANVLAQTYSSFMGAVTQSKLMQQVWAFVTLSQAFVLLWFQVGIPAVVTILGVRWASAGDTANWAYALVGACVGMGPLVLRTGPGASGGIASSLKSLIGK